MYNLASETYKVAEIRAGTESVKVLIIGYQSPRDIIDE